MCGLAALFAYGPTAAPVTEAELLTIRDHMTPRGPDGSGAWMSPDGRLGLGHRRLAIIELTEAGAQPMHDEGEAAEGAVRITYNGEIYNFKTLKRDLEALGHTFKSNSDTEVLLKLYREHGRDMVKHLRGMYAFAIWDEKKRGLLLGRDGFGIKPLYYANDGATVRVASQVKALLAGGRCGTGPDPAGHVGFYLFGYVPEPHTLYKDIRLLPAGSTLWVDGSGVGEPERFFAAADLLTAPPSGEPMPDFREVVLDSVRHHLVSDVPVGLFLSAGIDSSALTALASEALSGSGGSAVKTMTLGFEEFRGTPRDEVPLAEIVAAQYGTDHVTRWVRGSEFTDEIDNVFAAMDQPSIDGVNTYFVAREAARAGLKVAISGLGGDELLGGYDTFSVVPRLVGLLGWARPLRGLGSAFRFVSAPALRATTSSKYAGLFEYGTSIGDAYLLRRGLFLPYELPRVMDADMARAGFEALKPLIRLGETEGGVSGARRKVSALETTWYMQNQLLRDSDWAGMAHSLEIRVPLVDETLFRRLAPWIGCDGGPVKRDLGLTPAKPLPEALLNRPKTGFGVPVTDWLNAPRTGDDRGFRGWARMVHSNFV